LLLLSGGSCVGGFAFPDRTADFAHYKLSGRLALRQCVQDGEEAMYLALALAIDDWNTGAFQLSGVGGPFVI